ncbi:hypothetical protein B296_00000528 [Ensete ventricosum]|uniref:Uncharacterized protein n=1 Tax=Ensete ventricosum TaxID=4639 RepID=A0A427B3M5_ENSVE|nr:hypothetical protein B296_00000528 [Ensete ventricosum]
MASEEAIDAKLEVFVNHMEEKMRSLFVEFSIDRLSNPRKSQYGETSDPQDDHQEHGHITSDLNNPHMKVDFPRWEEGDPIGWISRAEHYFRFYRTVNATRLEIRGEVKARQQYTLMATISFARIQEEQLNHEVRRTRVAP